MMRVLHVHDRAQFRGGVEQILHDLAAGLRNRGWSQALLYAPDTELDGRFTAVFDRVCDTLDAAADFQPDVAVLHKWEDAGRVAELIARWPSVQVVHDHDFYCPRRHKYFPLGHRPCNERAGGACARNLCLLERRDGLWPVGLISWSAFRQRLQVSRSARMLVAGSRYSAAELERNGFDVTRTRIVPPVPAAIDAAPCHAPGEQGRMLFVGQVVRGKGLDLLLQAAAGLTGDWQLDVVGEGRQLDECRQQAAALGIADRVHFAGWVAHHQLDDWYRRASFTVVPSRWPEPFGMIGLESMARGRPVIAFDSGGIRDWLQHGLSGERVPAADVTALRAAMQGFLAAPERVAQLGRTAAAFCRKRYGHARYLDAMQAALRHAAGCELTTPAAERFAICNEVASAAVATGR